MPRACCCWKQTPLLLREEMPSANSESSTAVFLLPARRREPFQTDWRWRGGLLLIPRFRSLLKVLSSGGMLMPLGTTLANQQYTNTFQQFYGSKFTFRQKNIRHVFLIAVGDAAGEQHRRSFWRDCLQTVD